MKSKKKLQEISDWADVKDRNAFIMVSEGCKSINHDKYIGSQSGSHAGGGHVRRKMYRSGCV